MLVYIKPLSIFPSLHSDTIFGAILSAINQLYSKEKVNYLIDDFKNNPPFIISSAFPVIFNEDNLDESIKFFPKIIDFSKKIEANENKENIEIQDKRKKYKKVEFIQDSIFFDLINGKLDETNLISQIDYDYEIKNKLLFKSEIKSYLNSNKFKQTIIPNNSVNRLTNSSDNIFYSEGFEFNNMGLFFLIEFKNDNEEYKNLVKSALKFLKDKGFGKDISTGKGHFKFIDNDIFTDYDLSNNVLEKYYEEDNIDRDISKNRFLTLSRFIPNIKSNDLKNINPVAYEIDSKRGRGSGGDLRKQIRFFKEGSTFNLSKNQPQKDWFGQVVPVNSKNAPPAVEYGFAFPLFFRRNFK